MKNLYTLYSETLDCSDPYGYIGSFGRKRANFQCIFKRSFLNECIRRIYTLTGDDAPMMAAHYDKLSILKSLNCFLTPPRMSVYEAKLERVKRRLFYESREQPRKLQKPKRNEYLFSECSYFKVKRHMWDIHRARLCVQGQLSLARKRIYEDLEVKSDSLENWMLTTNNQGASEVPQPAIWKKSQAVREINIKVCRKINTQKEIRTYEEQYSQRSLVIEKVVEAAIRFLLFLKTLTFNYVSYSFTLFLVITLFSYAITLILLVSARNGNHIL